MAACTRLPAGTHPLQSQFAGASVGCLSEVRPGRAMQRRIRVATLQAVLLFAHVCCCVPEQLLADLVVLYFGSHIGAGALKRVEKHTERGRFCDHWLHVVASMPDAWKAEQSTQSRDAH